MVHHSVAAIFAYIGIFGLRDASFIFADMEEFAKPRNLHILGLCFTSGYLITDALMMLVSVIDSDEMPD
jgi:hypothetical protein